MKTLSEAITVNDIQMETTELDKAFKNIKAFKNKESDGKRGKYVYEMNQTLDNDINIIDTVGYDFGSHPFTGRRVTFADLSSRNGDFALFLIETKDLAGAAAAYRKTEKIIDRIITALDINIEEGDGFKNNPTFLKLVKEAKSLGFKVQF